MGYYIVWIAIVLAFGWYWNNGFSPLRLAAPKTDVVTRWMVNVFAALSLILSVLQVFGVGR